MRILINILLYFSREKNLKYLVIFLTHLNKYFLERFGYSKFFSKMSNEPISKDHCGLDYWKERWILNDIRFHKERNHP